MFMISADQKSKIRNGFCVEYENGYSVSVQFGYGNYCDNYNGGVDKPKTAECAVILEGEFCQIDETWSDSVKGHMTAEQVTELMCQVMKLK